MGSIPMPQNSYGGVDGLRRLVDACHRSGIAVVLDVVYNHLGPESNYAGSFGPYFTDRYNTPWGAAINFDGPGSEAFGTTSSRMRFGGCASAMSTPCGSTRYTLYWITPRTRSLRNSETGLPPWQWKPDGTST